eukprot:5379193-Amphidinium_carterae.1
MYDYVMTHCREPHHSLKFEHVSTVGTAQTALVTNPACGSLGTKVGFVKSWCIWLERQVLVECVRWSMATVAGTLRANKTTMRNSTRPG